MSIAGALTDLNEHLRAKGAGVAAASKLLLCLIRLQHRLSEEQVEMFEAAMAPILDEYYQQVHSAIIL